MVLFGHVKSVDVFLWSEIGSWVVWFMFTLFHQHRTEVVFDFCEIVDGSYKLHQGVASFVIHPASTVGPLEPLVSMPT
jgi:hypothetical protein